MYQRNLRALAVVILFAMVTTPMVADTTEINPQAGQGQAGDLTVPMHEIRAD
ncbi:hypothetical protein ACJ5NV_11695 [Loktanella agnita]|uniref:hypothetical protein n=1 Tax=Loktanella agnita TaxID=287097 RepID=UPI003986A860